MPWVFTLTGRLTDAKPVRRASRALWGDILRAGAEIYEYQPTMFHCKVLIVDGLWVSVGSTNFDPRSFVDVKSDTCIVPGPEHRARVIDV